MDSGAAPHRTTLVPTRVTGAPAIWEPADPAPLRARHRVRAVLRSSTLRRPAHALHRRRAGARAGPRRARCETLVHLVVTRAEPRKALQFPRSTCLGPRTVAVAREAGTAHFVYARRQSRLRDAGLRRGSQRGGARDPRGGLRRRPPPFLHPRPGPRWPGSGPHAFAKRCPRTRAAACRLDLVTLARFSAALVHAVEHPPGRSGSSSAEIKRGRGSGVSAPRYSVLELGRAVARRSPPR